MFSFFVVLVEVLASIIVLFCTSLFGLEAMQFCDVCKPLSLGEAGERPPFYKKNIPYSDNDACKGTTLNSKKSKELKVTDCLSSIASHH